MNFPCDKCGACCRHLKLFGEAYAWLVDVYTGMCRYFDAESNLCVIYPIRPVICNLALGHALLFADMPWAEFVEKNMQACKLLKNMSD